MPGVYRRTRIIRAIFPPLFSFFTCRSGKRYKINRGAVPPGKFWEYYGHSRLWGRMGGGYALLELGLVN